ncbi:MAG: hypothetical protein ACRDMZ_22535 [Solirubrobacteraceae bacterium]
MLGALSALGSDGLDVIGGATSVAAEALLADDVHERYTAVTV